MFGGAEREYIGTVECEFKREGCRWTFANAVILFPQNYQGVNDGVGNYNLYLWEAWNATDRKRAKYALCPAHHKLHLIQWAADMQQDVTEMEKGDEYAARYPLRVPGEVLQRWSGSRRTGRDPRYRQIVAQIRRTRRV